ncbi:MAG: iron-containing alcohol dehydrogenase [Pseudomonadota bacterium]
MSERWAMDPQTESLSFRASGFDWRLFCGDHVIESNLRRAVERVDAKRAMVICSPSIANRTNLLARIAEALQARYVGCFDGIQKDSTFESVNAATHAARDRGADLLIAVGGGSVIVSTRAVAIFLGEPGDPFEIMTQYPDDGRPYSPRLMAPKLPIINIPTTPTSAMNRAGTGLKNPGLSHRMEYFDPKTRPSAIFIDDGALMTAPTSLIRSTATTVFASLIGSSAHGSPNPLVEADQSQAFNLGVSAYRRLGVEIDNPMLRRNLSLSAFLQNRAEDDGRALTRSGPFSGDYAVSTALHIRYPHVGQGESTSVLQGPAIRIAKPEELGAAERVARGLDVFEDGMTQAAAAAAVVDCLHGLYTENGMPPNLRSLGVEPEDFDAIAAETVKNFNARVGRGTPQERIERTLRLLNAAW